MFTVEEITLIASFDHSSRAVAITSMLAESGKIADPDLKDQVLRTVNKLRRTGDEDFVNYDFTVYEEDDNEYVE